MIGLLEFGYRGEDPTSAGLEHAALGVGEAGVVGSGARAARLLEGTQSRGGFLGGAAQGGRALRWSGRLSRPGIPQKRLAGGAVSHGTVAGQEGGSLQGVESVAVNHPGEMHLLRLAEGAQPQGRREGEFAVIEQEAERRGELAREGEAALDPGAFLPQELSDCRHGEAIVVGQRGGHVRFVHGADRASGSVRGQEPRFHGDTGGEFDHDGDLLTALGTPDGQTLEAIDQLVDAVTSGRDSDGKRGEEDALVATLAAKETQGGPETIHGDVLDKDHGEPSSGRSWKSGYR